MYIEWWEWYHSLHCLFRLSKWISSGHGLFVHGWISKLGPLVEQSNPSRQVRNLCRYPFPQDLGEKQLPQDSHSFHILNELFDRFRTNSNSYRVSDESGRMGNKLSVINGHACKKQRRSSLNNSSGLQWSLVHFWRRTSIPSPQLFVQLGTIDLNNVISSLTLTKIPIRFALYILEYCKFWLVFLRTSCRTHTAFLLSGSLFRTMTSRLDHNSIKMFFKLIRYPSTSPTPFAFLRACTSQFASSRLKSA